MDNTNNKYDIVLQKQAVRKRMSIWRESLQEQDVQDQSAMMAEKLLRLINDNQDYFESRKKSDRPCVGLYNAFRHEADFSSIWHALQKAGWELSFPIMVSAGSDSPPGRALKFIRAPIIKPNDPRLDKWFIKGHFGVQEPPEELDSVVEPDLIVLPGLAFDRQGGRLGWGKAYYDSYLAGRAADKREVFPLTLGAALEGQLIDEVPTAEHDVAVAGIITPAGIILTDSCFVELFI